MTQTNGPNDAKQIEDWKARLAAFQTANEEGDKWLQLLYGSYLQRFLSDNNRVWTAGQLMIPLSLAPFTLLLNLPRPFGVENLMILAFPSIALILAWAVIAENHKAFQENSREWLEAIEQLLGVKKPGSSKSFKEHGFPVKPKAVRSTRRILVLCIIAAWLVLMVRSYYVSHIHH